MIKVSTNLNFLISFLLSYLKSFINLIFFTFFLFFFNNNKIFIIIRKLLLIKSLNLDFYININLIYNSFYNNNIIL